MDTFKKLLDLYVEINEIYLNLCREDIDGLSSGKGYLYLVKLLKGKVIEEKKLFQELFESLEYEEIKKPIYEEDNIITARLKDYIKTHEALNISIDEEDDEEVVTRKQLSMKVSKLMCSCLRNIFLVYSSFLDEFIKTNNISELRERLLTIKYYNSFKLHDVEDVFLDCDFNAPLENYVDVYLVAETLGVDVTECDEIILDAYLGCIEDMSIQLMGFNDNDYSDYNKLAVIANGSFMLQGCFALISEKDFLANKDKIFDKIEELRNGKNNKSANLIMEIINTRERCQMRVKKISLRPFIK